MTASKSTGKPFACKPVRARENAFARPRGVAGQCHPSPRQSEASQRPLRASDRYVQPCGLCIGAPGRWLRALKSRYSAS